MYYNTISDFGPCRFEIDSATGKILAFHYKAKYDPQKADSFIRPVGKIYGELLPIPSVQEAIKIKGEWVPCNNIPLDLAFADQNSCSVVHASIYEGKGEVRYRFALYDFSLEGVLDWNDTSIAIVDDQPEEPFPDADEKRKELCPVALPKFIPLGEWELILNLSPVSVFLSINGNSSKRIPDRSIPSALKILQAVHGHSCPEYLKDRNLLAYGTVGERLRILNQLPNLEKGAPAFQGYKVFNSLLGRLNTSGKTMAEALCVDDRALQKALAVVNDVGPTAEGMITEQLKTLQRFSSVCRKDIPAILDKYNIFLAPSFDYFRNDVFFDYLEIAATIYPRWGLDELLTLTENPNFSPAADRLRFKSPQYIGIRPAEVVSS